ncbi:MAG TPA: hypothetical protein VGN81_42080 [Pseudonocardiaceae bacterium]|jgi:uncharacterized protein YukE
MTDLDLSTDTDVDSVHATATGLSGLASAIGGTATGIGSAIGASADRWQGSAADAFRGRMGGVQQATAQAAAAATRMSTALHTFAGQMQSVHDLINQARAVATGAGLSVSGETIQAPKPPPSAPAACYTPAAAQAIATHQAALEAEYQRKLRAFDQARQLLTRARTLEQQAHQDVSKAAADEHGILADLDKNKYWLAGGLVTSAVAGGLDQRTAWLRKTQQLGLEYDRLSTAAANTEDPAARIALRTEAQTALDRTANAADIAVSNARLGLGVDPASDAGKVFGHLPDVLTGAQAAVDIAEAHGVKGKVVAGAADAASYGAGEAVTAGGTALLEGLSIGGAPETFGLSLVAGGAAYGVGTLVQHYGPDVYDWTTNAVGNVASSVSSAVTHPGRTLSSLGDDIANAI